LHERVESEKRKPTPNKALIDELGVAFDYIESDYASTIQSLSSLAKHDEITFDLLWTLFPPNAKIHTKDNFLRQQQVLKLRKGDYARRQNGSRYYSMDTVFIAHDGEKLGWTERNLTIDGFDGAKKLCNLSCVPLDQHPEKESIRTQLRQRGQRYLELLSTPTGTYQEYLGPAVTENRDVIVNDEFKKVTIYVSGRIMLDNPILAQQNKYTDLLKPFVSDEILGSYMTTTSISDEELLYCNYCIGGFAFRLKKWCIFSLDSLRPVVWNANAFSKLVMDTRKRNLIHSLVKSHKNGPESFDDVVAGKGRGLVCLLSGSPGVGKTLTAEVIAEVTKRPLYMLSAGELGTCVDTVEEKLDIVLEVTRQWGCVLLIDEADVFLQERDGLDLERNALVSVFLRRLEYFQGVLVMTTNRKRTIDAAFESRIHFKLHYKELEVDSRYTIWKNCLNNTPAGLEKSGIREEDVRKLAELKLNGRQIKNAVACAVSIAVEEYQALTMEGIQVILDMVLDTDGTD
jgi:DNA polymerase III delta prime subunit